MRSQLEYAQNDVNQVVQIMKENIVKVIDRDEKLTHLDKQVEDLSNDAMQFQTNARHVKRKQCWKNVKMWIILIILLLVIIIVVVTLTVTLVNQRNNDNNSGTGK
ncbi:unnamed protein product [Didymodactylos carnosus]|uniref:V-SNARE coiled-coil homology domain-containing protein n=1 Tax=Didymodactylos carnosus TaxID=1234261 RepID=A0A815E1W4_9BILA|nr:unnamed protein product [Didymodactylos carnosus]CAF1309070.1 unnamed protein product [Didymodactylos carnosus]CAF3974107.1 unnamed protein product [Didymodactylos carnosus]CAF4145073.1 unnamed protein product [Didymodactylos carnosus]